MPRPVSIEVSETEVKIVQLAIGKKGELQLESAIRISFEDLPRGDEGTPQRVQRIKDVFKQYKIPVEEVTLVISKQSATVRKVRMPSTDPEELASMITFEAEKIIPFNVERHIISHSVLRQHEIEGSDVLIAAVDEPVMQQWFGLVKSAGIDPLTGVVSALSLGYGVLQSVPDEERRRSIGVLSIGTVYTDITLLSDHAITATRAVKHGVRSLLDELNPPATGSLAAIEELKNIDVLHPERIHAHSPNHAQAAQADSGFEVIHDSADDEIRGNEIVGQWITRLVTHLQRTYEFALREYSVRPIEKIYITGEGALIPHLADALKRQLNLNVEIFNPLQKLERIPKGRIDEAVLPSFGTAYGAALQLGREGAEQGINILPPSVLLARRRSELRLHYIATGIMALIALVVVYLWFDTRGNINDEKIKRYDSYSRVLGELVENVDGMKARMGIIREIRSERAGALQILEHLSRYNKIGTVPEGTVSLDSFAFNINQEIRLSGQALETEDLNTFLQYLRSLTDGTGEPIFENADIVSQEPRPLAGRDRTVYRFDIVATLKSRGRK